MDRRPEKIAHDWGLNHGPVVNALQIELAIKIHPNLGLLTLALCYGITGFHTHSIRVMSLVLLTFMTFTVILVTLSGSHFIDNSHCTSKSMQILKIHVT